MEENSNTGGKYSDDFNFPYLFHMKLQFKKNIYILKSILGDFDFVYTEKYEVYRCIV